MKILIEHRSDPNTKRFTDPINKICKELGHETAGWRGPLSGRVPYQSIIHPCHLAIIWNGIHPSYRKIVGVLRNRKTPILFAELGWYPHKQTFQLDPMGFNIRASWAKEPPKSEKKTRLKISNDGHILVLLQIDADTQITQNSTWFKNMHDFVLHIIRATGDRKIMIRRHPGGRNTPHVDAIIKKCPRAVLDSPRPLKESADEAVAVAVINTSAGIEILSMKKPILSFGESIYRKDGAVAHLDNNLNKTKEMLKDLSKLEIYEERIDEIYNKLLSKQWVVDDNLSSRLNEMIKSLCILLEK